MARQQQMTWWRWDEAQTMTCSVVSTCLGQLLGLFLSFSFLIVLYNYIHLSFRFDYDIDEWHDYNMPSSHRRLTIDKWCDKWWVMRQMMNDATNDEWHGEWWMTGQTCDKQHDERRMTWWTMNDTTNDEQRDDCGITRQCRFFFTRF
jgi:hypothetical protein